MSLNENAIQALEHDQTYHVKRVSSFVDDGSGNLVRQMAEGFNLPPYDTIEVNYTDSTKATISTVVYKKGVTTVATITLTQASTKDTYTKS